MFRKSLLTLLFLPLLACHQGSGTGPAAPPSPVPSILPAPEPEAPREPPPATPTNPVPPLAPAPELSTFERVRLQAAIAKGANRGICFGMPSPWEPDPHFSTSETATHLRALYPDLTEQQREDLSHRMEGITLTSRADGGYDYAYRDGHCCDIRSVKGSATITVDDHIIVGKPTVVDAESVPC